MLLWRLGLSRVANWERGERYLSRPFASGKARGRGTRHFLGVGVCFAATHRDKAADPEGSPMGHSYRFCTGRKV